MKKYEFTEETITTENGNVLHRIRALRDFSDVKVGDLGGFIECEANLSHYGDCWVYNNACVFDYAYIYGNAVVCDNAVVDGNAVVCDNAVVWDKAKVCDDAVVCDDVVVEGMAEICGNAAVTNKGDYIVFKNWWSSGRYFTWTRSNNMWKVGCFYGTGDELIKKAYKNSEEKGQHYKEIVEYVEKCVI